MTDARLNELREARLRRETLALYPELETHNFYADGRLLGFDEAALYLALLDMQEEKEKRESMRKVNG